MEKLIQYATKGSYYNGRFDSSGWFAAGMGYMVCTAGGHLIAIDGGNIEDGESFLSLLEANADGGTPVVDLWIITHPHRDHYGALLEICRHPEWLERVKIKKIVWNIPENSHLCPEADRNNMQNILSVCGAESHTPVNDEKLMLEETEIHFLLSVDDTSFLTNPNELSLVFTIRTENKKIMFTGDAYRRSLYYLMWRYDRQLKCDILQLPHHGLCDTGVYEFYKKADASTVLIPTCVAGYTCMHGEMYGDRPKANLWAEDHAETVYRSFDGTVEIEL